MSAQTYLPHPGGFVPIPASEFDLSDGAEWQRHIAALAKAFAGLIGEHLERLRCTEPGCARGADTVHFTEAGKRPGGYPHRHVLASFACPRHDHGGYWFRLERLEAEPDFWEHLAEKIWGPAALAALLWAAEEQERGDDAARAAGAYMPPSGEGSA